VNFFSGITSAAPMRALLFAAVLAGPALAQSVYTWRDSDGTVVYSDEPPAAPAGTRARTTTGAPLSVISKPKPFPLPGIDGARWRADVPQCKAALEKVDAQAAVLMEAERRLNAAVHAFAPCQRFNDVCSSKALTQKTWETECQRRPAACAAPAPDGQQVEALREEAEALVAWLGKMGAWGCLS
jgi:hypothetical protein